MRSIVALCLIFTISGCSAFIVHEADPFPLAAGKVFTRIIFGIATFGMTEVGIKKAKRADAAEEYRAKILPYIEQECEKSGYTQGTPEREGCVAAKFSQLERPEGNSGAVIMMPGSQQRMQTSCVQSGRYTHCY